MPALPPFISKTVASVIETASAAGASVRVAVFFTTASVATFFAAAFFAGAFFAATFFGSVAISIKITWR